MTKLPPRILATATVCASTLAQGALPPVRVAELVDLSLEQLAQVSVTSATRRPERLAEVPASIFVITREDIRRSGATSLPEALRLAPALHVARTDTMQYAVSARGGATSTANKMLVLVDGRTIYSPLFSGVFWDAQDVALEDVERIEVVSGPAGTLWGTNGMNGVISVTTLAASRSQGTMVSGVAGTQERGGTLRHGGSLPAGGAWRAYAKHFDRDGHDRAAGGALGDGGDRLQAGFRADWSRVSDDVTLQGDAYRGAHGNPGGRREVSGGNLLARWSGREGGNDYRLQAYYDRTDREHAGTFRERRDTFDLDYSRLTSPWSAHRIVWGGGYRASRDRIGNSPALAFMPDRRTLSWTNVFVQDEVALAPDLKATVGMRLEHNSYTGWEWLPNARLAWVPGAEQLLWIAASRAVRAPSRIDREFFSPGTPPHTVLAGGPGFVSEIAKVLEVGYRARPHPDLSMSLTAFHGDLEDHRSIELIDGARVLANGLEGRSRGLEGWGTWRVDPSLRVAAGFLLLSQHFRNEPGRTDLGGLAALGNDPKRTASARVEWDFAPGWQLDVGARYAGRLPDPVVPSHTVVDARLGWRASRALDVSLRVENVLGRQVVEFGPPSTRAVFGRAFLLRLTWQG